MSIQICPACGYDQGDCLCPVGQGGKEREKEEEQLREHRREKVAALERRCRDMEPRTYPEDFGKRMFCMGVSFSGCLDADRCSALSLAIVKRIGMTPVSEFTEHFTGMGVGITHFRTLIESFVVIDSWFPKIEGGYLWVSSCKAFDEVAVHKVLGEFGLEVRGGYVRELELGQ